MKIVETLELVNVQKVFLGDRDIKLTLDTENGRLSLSTPAMFTDPIVSLDALEEKIRKLREHEQR